MTKLWGGRFSQDTDKAVERYTTSIFLDARLWKVDLLGSLAHAKMLFEIGVLNAHEVNLISKGLEDIQNEIHLELSKYRSESNFKLEDEFLLQKIFNPNSEDIHSEIEARLYEKIGPIAGKLHTARSRNDQVATDLRLYLREEIDVLVDKLISLQDWIIKSSEDHLNDLLPGLTHMQHAQPVSLSHHLMAYFWMFQRDKSRLMDCSKKLNQLPLGSAALAGTSFKLDREMVRSELNFSELCENSLDAVSDRDFVVEFLSASSLMMTHLSRLAEELILWSTPEFGFVELSDSVTTGSSIMPQKKNPDVAELIRGRTGRVHGSLIGILTVLKALPLSYNRDLQEDKFHLFNGLDCVSASIEMIHRILIDAQFNTHKMQKSLSGDFSNATDLADFLVTEGLTFREAHEIVGRIVSYCIANNRVLEEMSLSELQKFDMRFNSKSLELIQHQNVMKARISRGGTSPGSVMAQIKIAKSKLFNNNSKIKNI